MKKLLFIAAVLFSISMLFSACGSHEKCPGVGQNDTITTSQNA